MARTRIAPLALALAVALALAAGAALAACGSDGPALDAGAGTSAPAGPGSEGSGAEPGSAGGGTGASPPSDRPTPPADPTRPPSDPGAPDADGSVSSPPHDPDQGGPPDLAATPVEPVPGVVETIPTAVDRFVADPASPVVEVWFWGGVAPCSVLAGVDVVEGPDQVSVVVRTGASPEAGPEVACIAIAQLFSTTVELSAPLGHRTLVDASH